MIIYVNNTLTRINADTLISLQRCDLLIKALFIFIFTLINFLNINLKL